MDDAKKKQALWVGTAVIILLVSLTVAEYLIGSYVTIWWGAVTLIGISILKATFVVREYMHVKRLFAADEEVH